MYIQVFSKELYDKLISEGRKCISSIKDINGVTVWTFETDGKEEFEEKQGFCFSNKLLMTF